MTRQECDARLNSFRLDLERQYRLVDADDDAYLQAQQLVLRHPLRSLDALQLASALAGVTRGLDLQFWTADRQQATAAEAEGLDVELVG